MQLTDLAFPAAWRDGAKAAARALLDHDSYLVCAHSRLDGDALSSMAALALFLDQKGKRYALHAPFGVPDNLDFLPLPAPVHTTLDSLSFRPRVVAALDCGNPGRLGEELQAEIGDYEVINIDHHVGDGMGTLATLVVPGASSTTQILASVLREGEAEFTPGLSSCLLLGLVTDTGGFRHANATPEVFALTAFLEGCGASVHKLRERLEKVWTESRMRLWGHMSSNVELFHHGAVALCTLDMDTMERFSTRQGDTEGFVEHMRELRSVRVAVFVREQSEDVCKFSLRSTEEVDVNAVAASLGGGGHINAAGGTLRMSLDRARDLLLKNVERALEETDAAAKG